MNTIEHCEVRGNHHEVGLAIGSHFADAIHRFFDSYERLQRQLLPFYGTSTGNQYYQQFLALHRDRFPAYMSELEGIAKGADRPFEEFFLVNLRGEFAGLMPPRVSDRRYLRPGLHRLPGAHPGRSPGGAQRGRQSGLFGSLVCRIG